MSQAAGPGGDAENTLFIHETVQMDDFIF